MIASFRFALIVFIFPALLHAHEGEQVESGEWIEKTLTVPHDSSWSTEHCLNLAGDKILKFRFNSPILLKFDLHLHPKTRDGSYQTEYLDQQGAVSSHQGKFEAKRPGAYCFDFYPVDRPSEDRNITLTFRID